MTVTAFGAILFVAMMVVLIFWRRHFIWFLSAMIPFPQTAMFIVAGQGISPFYVAAIAASALGFGAVIRSLLTHRGRFLPFRGAETILLAAFAVWATFITLLGPRIFAGTGVISPRLGVDDQLAAQTPLEFTISNVAQLAYMLLGVGVVIYVLSLRRLSPRVLEVGIWVGLLFTAANATFLTIGLSFPRELFDTIPTIYYQSGGRLRGPFAEPSVLGAFLVAAAAYLVHRALRAEGWKRLIPIIGVVLAGWEFYLSTSGTVFVAGAVVSAMGVAWFVVRWIRSGLRGMEYVTLLGLTILTVTLSQWGRVYGFLDALVGNKLVSDSLQNRSAADEIAYQITLETLGVGVGLGSNRPSGFIAMLLSCVGLIGTALFLATVARAAFRTLGIAPEYAGSAWALIGVVTALTIAKADLGTPMLWMALAACMWACAQAWEAARASRAYVPDRELRDAGPTRGLVTPRP